MGGADPVIHSFFRVADAVVNPDGVTDRVDEGTLVTDYPGVNPIACLPGSPSGAFLD